MNDKLTVQRSELNVRKKLDLRRSAASHRALLLMHLICTRATTTETVECGRESPSGLLEGFEKTPLRALGSCENMEHAQCGFSRTWSFSGLMFLRETEKLGSE